MSTQISLITPEQLHAAQQRGEQPALLDVRTAAEYRAGHIPTAQLIPVEEVTPNTVANRFKRPSPGRQETLYVACQSGARAEQAAARLNQAGLTNLALVMGGTQRWEQAGLPVHRSGNAISLERQVQIAVGSLLIIKVFLGYSVHELFFALAAMIGAGLIVAGATRWCGMALLIARMPWNRPDNRQEQAKA